MKIKNVKLHKEPISYGKLVNNGRRVFCGDVIEVSKEIGERFIKCKGFEEVKAKEVKSNG